MVNGDDKKKSFWNKSALRPIFPLLIIFLTICTGIYVYKLKMNSNDKTIDASISTSDNKNNNNTDTDKTTNGLMKDLPTDLFFRGSLKDDTLIGFKQDSKSIYAYDINNGNSNIIANVNDSNNFIKTIICNSQWIVWVENDKLIDGGEGKSFKWQMIAQNVASGKKIVIDKSSFTSNDYDVPMFVNFTPDKISIYNNTLVYCKTVPNGTKIETQLVCYNIDSNSSKIISSTDDVRNEMIADCYIYENKITWSKYKELNKNYNERLTQYRFSDIFLYDLDTKTINQLTDNDFYTSPSIFKDKMAAVKIPLKKSDIKACNSEIVMIDLNTKKIQTIVDENSECYSRAEKELYRCNPVLTDKYLSWANNTFSNTFIYDYNENKFINLLKTKDNNFIINRIYAVYGNYALMYKISDEEKNNKNMCIYLDSTSK